jgi:hypothetical protein
MEDHLCAEFPGSLDLISARLAYSNKRVSIHRANQDCATTCKRGICCLGRVFCGQMQTASAQQLTSRKAQKTWPVTFNQAAASAGSTQHRKPLSQAGTATDRGCGGAQPQRVRICVEVRLARSDAIANRTLRLGSATAAVRSLHSCPFVVSSLQVTAKVMPRPHEPERGWCGQKFADI